MSATPETISAERCVAGAVGDIFENGQAGTRATMVDRRDRERNLGDGAEETMVEGISQP